MTTSTDVQTEIEALTQQIAADREKLVALRRQVAPKPVADYTFTAPDGSSVTLSSLFGDKDELLVIHNMGVRCSYCTMWSDGFNGVLHHLENRAAFAVVSPDAPNVQQSMIDTRGWRFKLLSHAGTSFSSDMGFCVADGDDEAEEWPGVSAFQRLPDGTILHTNKDLFGPGDPYCGVWPLLDLLPRGQNDWGPKMKY